PDAPTLQKQLDRLGYRIDQPRPSAPANPDAVLEPLLPSLPPGSTFGAWAESTGTAVPVDDSDPTAPGALMKLILLQQAYTALAQFTRDHEVRLGAHDRLLVLQRQHLDVLSSHGSSLAGGVPADGTGLQFARLLPFVKLDIDAEPTP